MSNYIMNKETGKIELHFDKADYLALDDSMKSEIKSNFLFSRASGAWVSRCKFPNLYRPEQVARKLGLENGGKVGELRTFEDQMNIKAAKAERRAERYEYKAGKAVETGKQLQSPIDQMHGDISFFTQPNISTASGRAFTNRRNRMFAAWERGFDEFKKSEYFQERAEIARQTAEQTRPTDKGFIDRRIKDAEKMIRAQKKNLDLYYSELEKLQNGGTITHYNGEPVTIEEVEGCIDNANDIIENAISKSIYYHDCLEAAGGVAFNKDNIKVGYIVEVARWGKCKVIGTGKVNITYQILTGGAAGMGGKASYAEIKNIISDIVEESKEETHNGAKFEAGKVYNVFDGWNKDPRGTIEVISKSAKFITYKDNIYNEQKRCRISYDKQDNEHIFAHWSGISPVDLVKEA